MVAPRLKRIAAFSRWMFGADTFFDRLNASHLAVKFLCPGASSNKLLSRCRLKTVGRYTGPRVRVGCPGGARTT